MPKTKTYRTHKACTECKEILSVDLFHKSFRDQFSSKCKNCTNKIAREKYIINKKDPEYRKRRAIYTRKNREKNPRSYLTRKKEWLKSLYGLTVEDYNKMLIDQNKVCAICLKKCKTNKGLAVDHDHLTGKVRGLLCANCNGGIGMLQEDPDIIDRAKQYILKGKNA